MLSDKDLDIIFRRARSHNEWQDKDVSDVTLQAIYDLMRWGPTSANCFPSRILFVKSQEAKDRLLPLVSPGNKDKVQGAPATAILAYDMEFYEKIPELFPHNPGAREWFAGNDRKIAETAFRNGTLQGAYFIIAARALGLDCGPMSGFDNDGVDQEFLSGTTWKSNFICAVGYGRGDTLHPRGPRPDFDEVCQIL